MRRSFEQGMATWEKRIGKKRRNGILKDLTKDKEEEEEKWKEEEQEEGKEEEKEIK